MADSSSSLSTVSAVWFSRGADFDPYGFLDQHAMLPSATWRAGDRIASRVRQDSGFSVPIGEAESFDLLVQTVIQFIEDNSSALKALANRRVDNVVSFMFGIGSEVYARTLSLSQEFITFLGSKGISIEVTACLFAK